MKYFKSCCALVLSATMLFGIAGCGFSATPKEPVVVTIWHYYNGAQQQMFDQLVAQFNTTVGNEKNIVVESVSQGGVNDVSARLNDSLNGKAGAETAPNIAALYADAAYGIYQQGFATDLTQYLSAQELAAYVPAYLSEGQFGADNGLYLFPVAKSTELFTLNETDWKPFADDVGITDDVFSTWEGITKVAKQYYEWTDAQTPNVLNDGKAFFGRDVMANYMIIGSLQLGKELFSVTDGDVTYQLDDAVLRRLWDNYYVPYVNGWFIAAGRFRADDVTTGDCIALVGSTSSATYFPNSVTRADGTAYPIEAHVYPLPNFEGTQPYAVQQGASMLVLKSDKAHELAAITFLQWFTEKENNLSFCLGSGYLPVRIESNEIDTVMASLESSSDSMTDVLRQTLLVGAQMTQDYTLYTSPAFDAGAQARTIVGRSLSDKAQADREKVLSILQASPNLSAAEVATQVATEGNFRVWADSLREELNALNS